MSWIGKIRRVGRITEPAAAAPGTTIAPPTGVTGSLQLRHVAGDRGRLLLGL
jgi:formate hydrogenlyase subunit 7